MRLDRVKLVAELTKRDMTQDELSKRAGISRTTICNIVGGKRCKDEIGYRIAEALDININDLM